MLIVQWAAQALKIPKEVKGGGDFDVVLQSKGIPNLCPRLQKLHVERWLCSESLIYDFFSVNYIQK